jgi:hypothetical protein
MNTARIRYQGLGGISIVSRYEQVEKQMQVNQIIVDREGMAVEFLASLQEAGRAVVTVLRTDQYRDLTSFTGVGTFVPLCVDTQGHVLREVAPARIAFPRQSHPGEALSLQVALIRDLRRMVAVQPEPEAAVKPKRKADRKPDELWWTQEGWQATPAPATPVTPKLIPIVTTADTADAVELARTYIHRWPAQENVIKDFLRPLGLDTNHGFAKTEVPNSEVSKQRSVLEKRLARLKQWAQSAGKHHQQAKARHARLQAQLNHQCQKLSGEIGWYQTVPTLCVNHKIPWAESVQFYGRFSLPLSSLSILGSPYQAGATLFFTQKAHPNPPAYLYRFRSWNSKIYSKGTAKRR